MTVVRSKQITAWNSVCDTRAVAGDGLPSTASQRMEDKSMPVVKADTGKVSRDCDWTKTRSAEKNRRQLRLEPRRDLGRRK